MRRTLQLLICGATTVAITHPALEFSPWLQFPMIAMVVLIAIAIATNDTPLPTTGVAAPMLGIVAASYVHTQWNTAAAPALLIASGGTLIGLIAIGKQAQAQKAEAEKKKSHHELN